MEDSRRLGAKAVVVATGTFLNGTIHAGRQTYSAGRAGEPASIELAENLKRHGFPVGRLKTGTPPRLMAELSTGLHSSLSRRTRSLLPFRSLRRRSSSRKSNVLSGIRANRLHQAIRDNLHQSPLYSGKIKGIGPRYCPSIEDKVVKFADKDRHQLFLEPEGHNTNEVYLNGFSTSLPSELQLELLQMIRGI